eukprot:1080490-Alexandrium_andersonii.AAC.1
MATPMRMIAAEPGSSAIMPRLVAALQRFPLAIFWLAELAERGVRLQGLPPRDATRPPYVTMLAAEGIMPTQVAIRDSPVEASSATSPSELTPVLGPPEISPAQHFSPARGGRTHAS